ncbi:Epoxide hydrolase [Tolypocladium paradoxum]|uniref:Epoxide hydrolase n=1 Tax=Tolypocladium paradoxum TaxID=94208 RepID=A0A2S4L0U5_9HYPO|nr:Epoxide hydrolase [Tolypocladium paradoxum]
MARQEEMAAAAALDEEIKPYKIHVSSKYLDLTRQKLELTRLPHDIPEPRSNEWWEPKPTVEPLIDYWLEQFSWRAQEQEFNANVPQFRTSIKTAVSETPLRLHFIHSRSPHSNAIPLLLIPPFPFTNLALTHLIDLFADPDDAAADQPFHLVIPSLPGLGFSDALTNKTRMVSTVAEMFDVLMKRLGYTHYLVTNSGPAANALAQVDWRLATHLAVYYPNSCLGVHFLSPPFTPPTARDSPIEWAKWKLASLLRSPILGYSQDDINAWKRAKTRKHGNAKAIAPTPLGFGGDGAYEPNTLAYALCDSPLGLLLFILMVIRMLGAKQDLSPADIIKMTELTWLPGPEGTMRLWAHCASYEEKYERRTTRKPRAAITVFLGDEEVDDGALPRHAPNTYACPVWGRRQYDIVSSNRVSGRPGLLAWERPELIAAGARGLAEAILAVDKSLRPSEEPRTTLLEQVLLEGGQTAPAETSGTTIQVAEDPAAKPQQEAYEATLEPAGRQPAGPARPDTSTKPIPIRPVTPRKPDDDEATQSSSGEDQHGDQESSESSPNTVIAVQVGA